MQLFGQQLVRIYLKQHRKISEFLVKEFFKVFTSDLVVVVELYSADFSPRISVRCLLFPSNVLPPMLILRYGHHFSCLWNDLFDIHGFIYLSQSTLSTATTNEQQ